MKHPTLWRLAHTDSTVSTQVAELLRVHLAHAALTTLLAQIGDAQRLYLVLDGCSGCADGRCLPGCRADLLRRALRACGAGELSLVREGLAARPYTRAVLALPTRDAQPLDSALLSPWSDARLVLYWRSWRGDTLLATALLLTGEGPDPLAMVCVYGWQTFPLLGPLLRRLAQPVPTPLPLGRRWQGMPYLPLPVSQGDELLEPTEETEHAPTQVDSMLAGWLRAAIDQPAQALHEAETARQESMTSVSSATAIADDHWPTGPGGMPPEVLGQLIPQILAEPAFRSTRRGQSGISKGRLAGLRHPYLGEANARTLMVWLDRADLLASPEDGQSPWRAPRVLVTDDLDVIAAKLHATPLPSIETVRAAYGGDQ
jgi:hypothetical protein